MLRSVTILCLLTILATHTLVFAGIMPVDKSISDGETKRIDGGDPIEPSNGSKGIALGSSRIGPLQMGETIYDLQHYGSMGRQVVYDANADIVHFYWMWDNLAGQGRAMKYNAYLSGGTWQHGSGPTGGLAVSGDNGGYGGIDLASGGRALGYHHQGINSDVYKPQVGIDIITPTGAFTFYGAPSPGADGAGALNCEGWETGNYELTSNYLYPQAEFDASGGSDVIHMVSTEEPPESTPDDDIRTLVYYRGTANPTTGVITWPSCGSAIDSVYNIAALVREDPLSDEVAISWLKPIYYDGDPADPCGLTQWQNDIMVWRSSDCGVTWDRGDIENVTDYFGNNGSIEYVPMAYTDHSMLYDSDGNLHIVWNTPLKGNDPCTPLTTARMWHWSDSPGGCISMVYDASKPRHHCDTGAWNVAVSKMNISECDDRFYVSFTRFGAHTSANGDSNIDCSAGGYANGEIFLTASSDGGETWGEAVNLTNTVSTDCEAGDCFSEHWSSMAKYSTGEVHIQYIEDKDAGGYPQTEGALTENPVNYLSHPCFTPDAFCQVSISPLEVGYPTHIAPQGASGCTSGETTSFNLTLQNSGNQATSYTVTPSDGWITSYGGDPLSGTIYAGCDATKTIEIQLGPIAAEGVYNGSLDITVCGESFEVPIELYVFCQFYTPEYEILSTACWSVGVWNVPRAGLAPRSDLGNMYWFYEEIPLMYDGGLVVSYDDTTNTFFSVYEGSDSDVGLSALSNLVTQAFPTYEYGVAEFTTPDSSICGTIEYYLPVHPDTCVLIEHVVLRNCDVIAHTVSVGDAVDFDIPDGEGVIANRAGHDPSRQMMYLYGPGQGGPEDYYYGGMAYDPENTTIAGGRILNNQEWVYPNGGFVPEEIGGLLNRISGFDSSIDSITDQSMFSAVFQDVELEPGDSLTFCKVKTSSLTGLANLQALVDKGFQWAEDYEVCGPPPEDCDWGDANSTGGIEIDDVVFLITFLEINGPAPFPLCNGNANGDCSVDPLDIAYIIAFIFQGGPAPVPGCTEPSVYPEYLEYDTLRVAPDGMQVGVGQVFDVPVYVWNDERLVSIFLDSLFVSYEIGSGLLSCDSVTYTSTRLDDPSILPSRSFNPSGFSSSEGGWVGLSLDGSSGPDTLAAGSGYVARLWFTALAEGVAQFEDHYGFGLLRWYIPYLGYKYRLEPVADLGTITIGDAPACEIETDPVLIATPLGSSQFKVRLRDEWGDTCVNPFGATVEILDYGSTELCSIQGDFPVLNPIDAGIVDGDLTFTLAAGGTPPGCRAKITVARDIVIEVPVVSVDYDGDLFVEPSDYDLVYSDLDNDGDVDDNDLYIFYNYVGEICSSEECAPNVQRVSFDLISDEDGDGAVSGGDVVEIVVQYCNRLSSFLTLESFEILGTGFGMGAPEFSIYEDISADKLIAPGSCFEFHYDYTVPFTGLGTVAFTGTVDICPGEFYVARGYSIPPSICDPSEIACYEIKRELTVGGYILTLSPPVPYGWGIVQEPQNGSFYDAGDTIVVEFCHNDVTTALDSLLYECYLCDTPDYDTECTAIRFKATIRGVGGDADCNCAVDIDDIVFLIAYVFQSGPAPCAEYVGDCNATCTIDIDDIVYLINYVFQSGIPPEPCPDQDK